jgi:hypothetical protein
MDSYWAMGRGAFGNAPEFGHSNTKPGEIVRAGNIYVVCEEDEDLAKPLNLLGENHIMLGSDIPHSESHPNSFRAFQAIASRRKSWAKTPRTFSHSRGNFTSSSAAARPRRCAGRCGAFGPARKARALKAAPSSARACAPERGSFAFWSSGCAARFFSWTA